MALVFLMAISLSMDAFSLSLIYGALGMSGKENLFLSMVVGIFHFVMPFLGMFISKFAFDLFKFDMDILTTFILCFIGLEMIISSFNKKNKVYYLKFKDYFLFGFAVSVDSFSVGITLLNIKNGMFAPVIFSLISFLFTFIGLSLGNKVEKLLGKVATLFGGTILFIIGIIYVM